MRRMVPLIALPLVLGGCEAVNQPETAAHALREFCALHKAQITHVLQTPDQIQAGKIVCLTVGRSLGASEAPD